MAAAARPPRITVVMPTFRRPGPLRLAARSVLAQTGFAPGEVEFVVADNDPDGSARQAFDDLAAETAMPMTYVHAPIPGVARARNAAMAVARGELVAFLDDDEEAPQGWLAALVAVQAAHDADVVFGPVRARLPGPAGAHQDYLERFFSRFGPAASGPMSDYFGCGNSLLRVAALAEPKTPFSSARDHIGGEDDLLFGSMKDAGARFAWAAEAWVFEHVPPGRATMDYALRRAFAFGQGPTAASAAATPPRPLGVVGWMAQGAVQACVFGALGAAQWLTRAPRRADTWDRAARGLGKLLWFGPFKIEFYGRAARAT